MYLDQIFDRFEQYLPQNLSFEVSIVKTKQNKLDGRAKYLCSIADQTLMLFDKNIGMIIIRGFDN